MVSHHQSRAELRGENRGEADLPPSRIRAELRGECRGGADLPPSASSLNWAGRVMIYIDDFLYYSETVEQHLDIMARVFERLLKHEIYLHPQKCVWGVS